jgi:prepilin-type N-terminal cleavage/methylation domain-containing protein
MQNKKGFTLLELIVAMAIIAVLMGLSLFGIQSVQRSQRDTERRAALSNINLEIAAFYGDNGAYPSSIAFANVSGTESRATIAGTTKVISLKGAAKLGTNPAKRSDTTGSYYCYVNRGATYQLGVYLEGSESWGEKGTAQQLGNDAGTCGTTGTGISH